MTMSTFRLGVGTLGTAALLLGAPALAAASTPTPAPHSTTAGVQSVTITPAKVAVTTPVTVTVNWCLPTSSVPGSVLPLSVPAQLTPLTHGFTLRDAAGDAVATAAVTGNTVALTAGSYVADHRGVCGTVAFPASINSAHVTVNHANTLVFRSGSSSLSTSFTPTEVVGARADEAITYGIWTNPYDQGRTSRTDALTWYLESPQVSYGTDTVHFTDTPGAGQRFDCAKVHVELGRLDKYHHFVFTRSYPGRPETTCSATSASVRISSLSSGTVARLVIGSSLAPAAAAPFTNSGRVSLDGDAASLVRSTKLVHYLPEGHASASATTPPTTPTSATSTAAAPAHKPDSASGSTHAASDSSQHGGLALLLGLGIAAVLMIGVALRSRRSGITA